MSRPDEALELATRMLEAALAAGAREAEATGTISRRFTARARDREISKLEHSTGRSVNLRVFVGEPGELRRASLSSSDLTPEGIAAFAARTVGAAAFVAPDRFAGLADETFADDGALQLEIDSADILSRADEVLLDDALLLERTMRELDPRIDNSEGSVVADTVTALGFANSRGLRAAFRTTTASRSAYPVARDGEHKRSGAYGTSARSWKDCEATPSVAREAARHALAMFGATTVATQKTAIVFERDVAAAVLHDLFAALSAANVANGNSYLAGKIGETIGSELVTIVDDGRLPAGLGTAPFDGEGVPTRRTVVLERGVLRSYLSDTYYARKLGMRSTGNSSGSGVSPRNFHLKPGSGTLDDLIAKTRHGILVLGTIGFATESVTGTYSRGAFGILIENGELRGPVEEFTIAGNFLTDILPGIDAVAGDLRFDHQVAAPSFRVAEMTVSGE